MAHKDFYNTKEAAEMLNVSVSAVNRMIAKKRLVATKINGAWLIAYDSLKRYVSSDSWVRGQILKGNI